jgi:DNA-nicking Smr family endonuclease
MEIDLHGLTLDEARAELQRCLKSCPKDITEIEVIHGYTNGSVLKNFVRRQFKHPRVSKKIITTNNGMTTFLLK